MRSRISEFKLFDRGFEDTILLIPGWATDYRIFDALDLNSNYLMPIELSPFDFNDRLLAALHENGLDVISILGWSMGAFLAWDFISEYPERIDGTVFIVSAKRRYERLAIEKIKIYLKKNRVAYLHKFYHECFSKDELESLSWFKRHLLKSYLKQMELQALLEGLDYLSNAELEFQGLERLKIKFVHGCADKIAPIEEAIEIAEDLPAAEFISIEGAGHMPFLNPAFSKLVGTE